MRRSSFPAFAAAAAILVWSAAASAAAVRLGWHESSTYRGKPLLAFEVASITFESNRWSATVSVQNRSSYTIRVGDSFGLVVYSDAKTVDTTKGGFGKAVFFSPARPTELVPGAVWRGVMGGTGGPKAGSFARIVFGPFSGVPGKGAFLWITDHVHQVPAAAGSAKPVPATPKAKAKKIVA